MSRRSRERANSRPWEQEQNAWNCPHCAPRICSCEWRNSEPESENEMAENHTDSDEAHLTEDQRALFREMSEISEDCWFAGWLTGNEFSIWDAIHGGSYQYGRATMDAEALARCKALSEKIGGWIIWKDDQHGLPAEEWGPYFIAMDDWLKLVKSENELRAQATERCHNTGDIFEMGDDDGSSD